LALGGVPLCSKQITTDSILLFDRSAKSNILFLDAQESLGTTSWRAKLLPVSIPFEERIALLAVRFVHAVLPNYLYKYSTFFDELQYSS
jgi:hypothetical protein